MLTLMGRRQISRLFFKARHARNASRTDAGAAMSISRLIHGANNAENSQPVAKRSRHRSASF
jgi:hypothetical protein